MVIHLRHAGSMHFSMSKGNEWGAAAALFLYRDWLPASGEEARDFPIYCQRLSFFPEVPEHEAVAELFLPLR